MPEQPCSADFPFRKPAPTTATPVDDPAKSFAKMDQAASQATPLKPILPCEKPYVEVSFLDDEQGTPLNGGTVKLTIATTKQDRPLDGSPVYRVDDSAADAATLIPVVTGEPKSGGGSSWHLAVATDLEPMEQGQPRPSPLPPLPPEPKWQPLGRDEPPPRSSGKQ